MAKVTKATAKALVKKFVSPSLAFKVVPEIDSEEITFWPATLEDREEVKKVAAEIIQELETVYGQRVTVQRNGFSIRIFYKKQPVDMGDWNDPSSRWHY